MIKVCVNIYEGKREDYNKNQALKKKKHIPYYINKFINTLNWAHCFFSKF